MPYSVIIKRQTQQKLKSLSPAIRLHITGKIKQLSLNPDNPILDIKPLRGQLFYRLRVGQWRIIYDRQDRIKIISIDKIKSRGDAYK